jgi:Protein of unknown function (DUF1549)/Protein of unknown function (DUF1553)
MITLRKLTTVCWLLTVLQPLLRAADKELGPQSAVVIRALHVEPAKIELRGANRQQQVLVTGETSTGRLVDVTDLAEYAIADHAVADSSGSLVAGVKDGVTRLTVRVQDQVGEVPVVVAGFEDYPPVHFANDVVPLLSKLGCNSGGCHGKATGQNGFKLSVFGFDPAADYSALVRESRGRRVFPASPERSLVLRKASGEVPHGGGSRAERGSREHELLLEWLKQGMPVGQADAPRLIGMKVSPAARIVDFSGQQQILATAEYSDGSLRDVTSAALYVSNAPLVAEASPAGQVTVGRVPGEAAITVNYMGQVAAVRILVPRPASTQPYPALVAHNRIDELVGVKLRDMGIVPSELADDATFLRRVYLDTLGTLPTIAEAREFLADTSASKRQALIERLLAREEFADFWALKWADILLVDRKALGDRGAFELHRWLKQQLATNRPYDAWVRELLTASGNSGQHGPVNFYRALKTPEELTRAVSQAFLGIRMECAQCHHHPFERWSQDDFYGLAGFFNGLERKPLEAGRELVYHAGWRETKVPVFNRVVATHVLDGPPLDLTSGDPRERLAQWLTEPNNPWFARLLANRLWKQFFNRGIVEPEDDLRSTNPATNEPLLAYLTQEVVSSGFDVRAVTRQILASRTYQTSSLPNATNRDDEQNFSRYYVKRLPAEVLLDAVSEVTGVAETFVGFPRGTRAIELWDNRLPSYFLEIFGRPARTSPCECGRSSDPTMSQALHLMNAPEVGQKISDSTGRAARLVQRGARQAEITEELCLAALARPPSAKERHVANELFADSSPRQAAEDFLWTLLNSYDFLFIH